MAMAPFLLFFVWLAFGQPGQSYLLRMSKSTYVVVCAALVALAVGLLLCLLFGQRRGVMLDKAPPPIVVPPQKGA